MPGKENDARAEACFKALYRTAFRLTGNKAQAEDLVQETYLRAWRSLFEPHGLSSVQPWMFRILRTVFIDQLRRESKRAKLVTDVAKMLAAPEQLSPPDVSDVKDRRNLDEFFDQEILIAMIALRGFDDATRKGIKVGTCEGRRVAAWDAGNVSYLMVSDLTKDALLVMVNQVVNSASQSLK